MILLWLSAIVDVLIIILNQAMIFKMSNYSPFSYSPNIMKSGGGTWSNRDRGTIILIVTTDSEAEA
ncbi:MAG: hypothetical protein ACR5KV_01985 [Wolbachia sp.]